MTLANATVWLQPLDPLHSLFFSALAAALPLLVVLLLMGGLRKSGLLSSTCGLATAVLLALFVWHMPAGLVAWSTAFGCVYALWPILWIVFAALWLYNLTQDTGRFALLQRWMEEHASGDPCIQAILVAFCFGALIEGTAGFGAPVAVTACLLAGLGLEVRKAVLVALIANTAPVAFGSLGIPIVALAGVTGLPLAQLSAMAGRQVPLLSFLLPAYLALVVGGRHGLRRAWPVALVAGASFALVQWFVSNFIGPYITDVLAASLSIAAVVATVNVWPPKQHQPPASSVVAPPATAAAQRLSARESFHAWLPWLVLSAVMILWSYLNLLQVGQRLIPVHGLHQKVFLTLYGRPYAAVYTFQPFGPGTGVLFALLISALAIRVRPKLLARSGIKAWQQLRKPGLTVIAVVALAYLYNYSGMAFTLGAAVAKAGPLFPFLSGYLGWVACFLSGSDTASNLLFGNLQVAAAHQLHLSPVLLAATNSSGAVAGKMISPQNIAIGVTTVGLVGEEGKLLRSALRHSLLLTAIIGLVALAQAYWLTGMVPH